MRFLFVFWLLAPALLALQAPRIGIIDFYGLRNTPEERVRAALGVEEGDSLPPSKSDVEERLERVRGIVRARLEAVCCEGDGAILYVGIEEKGAPHYTYRFPPEKKVSLPDEVVKSYRRFIVLFEQSARGGSVAEDLRHGHALAANPDVRALQEGFAVYAAHNVAQLRDVLRNSDDSEQRAIAAYVIGYAPRKEMVVNDLQYALQDPNDSVRYNAMRALTAIWVLAEREQDLGIRLSPTWLIEMLNSILWRDRTKAAKMLVDITEHRDPETLAQLRDRALPSLIEMARWKSLSHALPAFILAGRIAGLSEKDIQQAWSNSDREAVLSRLTSKK